MASHIRSSFSRLTKQVIAWFNGLQNAAWFVQFVTATRKDINGAVMLGNRLPQIQLIARAKLQSAGKALQYWCNEAKASDLMKKISTAVEAMHLNEYTANIFRIANANNVVAYIALGVVGYLFGEWPGFAIAALLGWLITQVLSIEYGKDGKFS